MKRRHNAKNEKARHEWNLHKCGLHFLQALLVKLIVERVQIVLVAVASVPHHHRERLGLVFGVVGLKFGVDFVQVNPTVHFFVIFQRRPGPEVRSLAESEQKFGDN